MVLADSPKISRVPGYSGWLSENTYSRYRAVTFFGLPFQVCSLCLYLSYSVLILQNQLETPLHQHYNDCNLSRNIGLGSSHFARHYFGNRFYFLFFELLRCFSSPTCLRITIYSLYDNRTSPVRFPHSDSCGSTPVSGSSQIIVAFHVLLRLLAPRYPSCALSSLTYYLLYVIYAVVNVLLYL